MAAGNIAIDPSRHIGPYRQFDGAQDPRARATPTSGSWRALARSRGGFLRMVEGVEDGGGALDSGVLVSKGGCSALRSSGSRGRSEVVPAGAEGAGPGN